MKKIFQIIGLILLCSLVSLSCTPHDELNCHQEVMQNEDVPETRSLQEIEPIFDLASGKWVRIIEDPYRIENMQRIYDEIKSEICMAENAERYQKYSPDIELNRLPVKLADLELKPSHYVLKIYPKSEEQKSDLYYTEDVLVSDIPFNYIPLSDQEAEQKGLRKQLLGAQSIDGRYTVQAEEFLTSDGEIVIHPEYLLPAFYALWPVSRAIPGDLDYIIQDRVLPLRETEPEDFELSPVPLIPYFNWKIFDEKPSINGGNNKKNETYFSFSIYDPQLDRNVPLPGLKIVVKGTTNTWTVYTDEKGRYTFPF